MRLDDDILLVSYNSTRTLRDGEVRNFGASYTAKLWFLLWLSLMMATLFIIIK